MSARDLYLGTRVYKARTLKTKSFSSKKIVEVSDLTFPLLLALLRETTPGV